MHNVYETINSTSASNLCTNTSSSDKYQENTICESSDVYVISDDDEPNVPIFVPTEELNRSALFSTSSTEGRENCVEGLETFRVVKKAIKEGHDSATYGLFRNLDTSCNKILISLPNGEERRVNFGSSWRCCSTSLEDYINPYSNPEGTIAPLLKLGTDFTRPYPTSISAPDALNIPLDLSKIEVSSLYGGNLAPTERLELSNWYENCEEIHLDAMIANKERLFLMNEQLEAIFKGPAMAKAIVMMHTSYRQKSKYEDRREAYLRSQYIRGMLARKIRNRQLARKLKS